MHTCPRCEAKQANLVSKSPVEGAWEIYLCSVCLFTWRSSEPETITSPEKYPRPFKVNPKDVPLATHVPPVPPRS
ncbi:non-oxidative hydroxyarylic acid decarboxylases subunit D [Priestia megaterium]|uniref:non-oxidative hydroxyarylic acid decarboxylases subunit D n=1 Tax=Priestia megaterium TaxID=1404 RepID=UPI0004713CFB|nr:non-oxidative hydroxyarylic acid decarboxylases subunit D [Priestia megaterium]PFB06642.1 hypothetical protein CN383_01295 [Priestia megaterium]